MRLSGIGLPRGSQGGQAGGRLLRFLHLDGYMLATVAAISVFGLLVLYSASGGELGFWLQQVARLGSFEYFPRTNRLEWSAEEKRIHGLDPDGPSPSFEAVVALMLPEDRAPTLALFEQFMRGDGAGAWDYRIVLPDGSLRHMSTRA